MQNHNQFIHHFVILFLLLLTFPTIAQEAAGAGVFPGTSVTGEITNSQPQSVFHFDGQRGERIALTLQATSGNLDPVLTVFDNAGTLVVRHDDSIGSRDIVTTLTLERTDRYFIVVSRFGQTFGTTSGSYELMLERTGVLSVQGSSLRYGDSVIDTITNMQPQVYYTFRADEGDIINVEMVRNSSNLDPYIQVVDQDAFVIADNDDVPGSDTNNALIQGLLIEEAGVYIIVATRYGQTSGDSAGSFVLTLKEADNSGLGNSTLAPFPIQMNQIIEDVLDATRYERFYILEAKKDDLISISLDRGSTGRLDSFVALANAGLQTLIADDDSGNGQNARINRYRVPADGTYYIIASRFGGKEGSSSGSFRLRLDYHGNAFDGVQANIPHIIYGTTVTGNINDTTPEGLYVFWGEEGDTITVSMTRGDGDLDAVVELLNGDLRRIVYDDDSGDGQNARIERYTLPRAGVYYVRATRYEGADGNSSTSGSYILVLARRLD